MKQISHFSFWRALVLCLTLVMTLGACSDGKPSADDLYKEEASGVALVLNKFYYDAQLPNGNHIYFSGIADDGTLTNLTDDVSKIRNNCGYLTGTAFFIASDGSMLTNRHVAQPIIDENQVKSSLNAIVAYVRSLYETKMEELAGQYAALEQEKESCVSAAYWGYGADEAQVAAIEERQQELSDQYDELSEVRDNLGQADMNRIRIRPVCQVGVAYNDSYVNDETDFLKKNPCRVVRVSQDAGTDLALIQLKSLTTPSKAHVFSTEGAASAGLVSRLIDAFKGSKEDDGKLKMNQTLYMIGYNAGIDLASTRRGIKVQMTAGQVTQLPDGERLLYSIPTMQGSSGSPVIDEQGRLVGVNFAKLNGTDNFNFGIPIERVRSFLGKN